MLRARVHLLTNLTYWITGQWPLCFVRRCQRFSFNFGTTTNWQIKRRKCNANAIAAVYYFIALVITMFLSLLLLSFLNIHFIAQFSAQRSYQSNGWLHFKCEWTEKRIERKRKKIRWHLAHIGRTYTHIYIGNGKRCSKLHAMLLMRAIKTRLSQIKKKQQENYLCNLSREREKKKRFTQKLFWSWEIFLCSFIWCCCRHCRFSYTQELTVQF